MWEIFPSANEGVTNALASPIAAEKDTNRTTRAVIAGFAKFFPIPPNSIFTTTIATKQPTIAIQNGNVDGRLKASNIPVTTALQSEMVLGCLVITLYKYSK